MAASGLVVDQLAKCGACQAKPLKIHIYTVLYSVYNNHSEVAMFTIKCKTQDTLELCRLEPFQGTLKRRSDAVIGELADSILSEGLLMPFVVWQTPDGANKLLDGHGRLLALKKLNVPPETELPVLYVQADSEDEAKRSLLQIVSSYGTISKKGALAFCSTIPDYKAPAIKKFVSSKAVKRKASLGGSALIRIKVPSDKEQDVRNILAGVDYIEVL